MARMIIAKVIVPKKITTKSLIKNASVHQYFTILFVQSIIVGIIQKTI